MADEIYKLAIERARRLRQELSRLDGFIATYDELSSAHSSPPPTSCEPAEPPKVPAPIAEHPPTKGVPQAEIERIALRVLLEHGAPLKRQALFEKVKATGTAIGGQDERANFGTKISRSGQFVNLPKLGYWPIDRPCGAAGYKPGRDA